ADRHETKKLTEALVKYDGGVYVRIGRNPVEDVYESGDYPFEIGKAVTMKDGKDVTIIAAGETVRVALDAAAALAAEGVSCRVLNMHTIKPLDEAAIIAAAKETGAIITVEEHSIYGGLGAAVAEVVVQNHPVPMKVLGIPDEPAIAGKTAEVFRHYGITGDNIKQVALDLISKR
ncbi:MAG: transketolase C-terminal domain-containing protein, partial [Paenibacillus macerans]|nr:transketolase C-terminal domain-containing protein [Paenibacillus macerans]